MIKHMTLSAIRTALRREAVPGGADRDAMFLRWLAVRKAGS